MTEITLKLRKLHPAQQRIMDEKKRFNVLKCGRRFGKTELGKELAINPMLDGYPVGYFAPIYKDIDNVWEELKETLHSIIDNKNEQLKQLRLVTGGLIDMWSLEDPDAGRGRKYKRIIVDECEKAKNLKDSWELALRGTLVDYQGDAFFLSTPKFGQTYFKKVLFNNSKKLPNWGSWKFTSYDNPYLPQGEIDEIKASLVDIAFRCEYMADDVNLDMNRWAFAFNRDKHLWTPDPDDEYNGYDPNEIVDLSFDFNRNPICCGAIQEVDGEIRVLKAFKLANSDIYELCKQIKVYFPDALFRVTGDASGMNGSAMVKDNLNYYIIIREELQLSRNQLKIPPVNPRLEDNQVLVNSILQNGVVKIHAIEAEPLVYDLDNVEMLADGSIKKTDRNDPTQQADSLDWFRYYCNTWHHDFIRRFSTQQEEEEVL